MAYPGAPISKVRRSPLPISIDTGVRPTPFPRRKIRAPEGREVTTTATRSSESVATKVGTAVAGRVAEPSADAEATVPSLLATGGGASGSFEEGGATVAAAGFPAAALSVAAEGGLGASG